jgi:hypothetical protein
VGRGEIPKYVRRNIFGADFLVSFGDVIFHEADANPDRVARFIEAAFDTSRRYLYTDRGARNLGALLLAALPVADLVDDFRVEALHVDDAVVQGTALPAGIINVSINQFDIRDANLERVNFDESSLVALIANAGTRVSPSFPNPSLVQETEGGTTIADPVQIGRYIDKLGRKLSEETDDRPDLIKIRSHPLYQLLDKVCRLRQYWIPDDSDDRAARLIREHAWRDLINLLRKHDLVREESRRAAGRPSTFYHIKKTAEILSRDESDPQVRGFLADVEARIRGKIRKS